MADVASDLKTWSTTASSNAPSGATTIGTGLDDNLREIQKVVRQDLASKGSDVASTATADVGAVAGLMHDITGTTTITSLGTVSSGVWKLLKFEGALTLTHNATSLILPGAANITTADGDTALFMSEGSGNWRCHHYTRALGTGLRTGEYFHAHKNGTNQGSIANAADTKITFTTEVADTAGVYDSTNSRVTPGVGERWVLTAAVRFTGGADAERGAICLFKNGSVHLRGPLEHAGAAAAWGATCSWVVEGASTDYYEIFFELANSGGQTVSGTVSHSYYQGIRIR